MSTANAQKPLRDRNTWLWEPRPVSTEPLATLVVLPHSGGLGQGYARWAKWFPEDVRVITAQYPGRGPRYGEEHARSMAAMAEPLAEALAEETELHVFGHSLGAMIGFEICWLLAGKGRPVRAFYPSAAPASQIRQDPTAVTAGPSDAELVEALVERGGMDRAVLEHPELLELVLEACRADREVTLSYRYGTERRVLDCPVIAFGGTTDVAVAPADLARWPELTTGPGEVHLLDGGHFYLNDHMAAVTGRIRRQMALRTGLTTE
ncbi:thioesterase II family protein [Salinispora arenicola]|uniref:thioesterase II family protein n=1 Tax=Salinispora arenicola TaxID=168697 RepID=UPI00038130E1|nr:alpha/beta fold hydrolase [Salinispora arenicola]